MQRHISLLGLVLATTLGTLAPALVTEGAGAASTVTQRPATNPSDIDAPDDDRAAVKLDGQILFQVRGIPAYPAKERARSISKRVEEIAADRSVAVESLRVVDLEDRTRIVLGDRLAVVFVDIDGAAEGVSRQLLAERALINIKAAIASYRNDRSPRALCSIPYTRSAPRCCWR